MQTALGMVPTATATEHYHCEQERNAPNQRRNRPLSRLVGMLRGIITADAHPRFPALFNIAIKARLCGFRGRFCDGHPFNVAVTARKCRNRIERAVIAGVARSVEKVYGLLSVA